jgi:hypothetical protein
MRLALSRARPEDLLAIHLNDHLALIHGEAALARRALRANRGSVLGELLAGLREDVEDDRRGLIQVMRRRGVAPDPLKRAAAAAAERVGRLKPNGQLRGYSDLSRLVEVEGLCAAAGARRAVWTTLARIGAAPDAERRAVRAQGHAEALERHRLEAAARAFSRPDPR